LKCYSITEFAEELGVPRNKISWLVKSGQIETIKRKKQRGLYKIPKSELEKFAQGSRPKPAKKSQKLTVKRISKKSNGMKKKPRYEEFIDIQKILVETMRDLAKTQEKIASTLSELVKKT
jgi:excisionase family DNA binding protein